MATATLISTGKRARRSKRLELSVPVVVRGKDMAGKEFRELTRAGSLNANGAMVTLSSPVEKLQAILVQNQNTQQEQECRVVNVWSAGNGKWCAGVEFTTPAAGFWEIYFPPVMRSRP